MQGRRGGQEGGQGVQGLHQGTVSGDVRSALLLLGARLHEIEHAPILQEKIP